jgi:hypothetical protein
MYVLFAREFYKSTSSSSSGVDSTHGVTRGEHSKSHWGNTATHSHAHSLGFGHQTLATTARQAARSCSFGFRI